MRQVSDLEFPTKTYEGGEGAGGTDWCLFMVLFYSIYY